MSLYAVQKVMFHLKKDPSLVQALKADAAAALAPFELDGEERAALAAADLPALYGMGVHPLLLAPYARLMGIARPRYQDLLSPLKGSRRLSSTGDDPLPAGAPAREGAQ